MDRDFQSLQRLVDGERIDELLRFVSLDDVARAYLQWNRDPHAMDREPDEDPHWWAVAAWLSRAWRDDETLYRSGLLALIEAAVSDDDLGVIGAGPLEDFISDDPYKVDWIERQSQTWPKFRRALANVWIHDQVSTATFRRVERAAGRSLADPHGRHSHEGP